MAQAKNQDHAAQIRAIREALGRKEGRRKPISQEEFADRVGTHVSAVKKWEGSEQRPSVDSLRAINRVVPDEQPELRFRLDEAEALPAANSNQPGEVHVDTVRAIVSALRKDLAPAQIERIVQAIVAQFRP